MTVLVFAGTLVLSAGYASLRDLGDDSKYAEPNRWASGVPRGGTDPAKFEPPDGYVYTGVAADQQPGDTVEVSKRKWDEWIGLMNGRVPLLSHTFEGFDTRFSYDFKVAEARGAVPLISWQTGDVSPRTIARAGDADGASTDGMILRNAKLSAEYGKPVFLRINQEMNAHWFPWSAYEANGDRRSFGPKDFQDMWRRMVIIFDGGKVRDINARLTSVGLPPLDAELAGWTGVPDVSDPDSYLRPASNVAFVFNPVDAPGIPDVSGNRWLDYYPGDEYVDWVGQTTYDATWNGSVDDRFSWMDEFYEEFSMKRGKPYMLGEWGLEPEANSGFGDDPRYVERMLSWVRSHPKVKALVYFSVNESKGDYRLSSYPDSAEALADGLARPEFLHGER